MAKEILISWLLFQLLIMGFVNGSILVKVKNDECTSKEDFKEFLQDQSDFKLHLVSTAFPLVALSGGDVCDYYRD